MISTYTPNLVTTGEVGIVMRPKTPDASPQTGWLYVHGAGGSALSAISDYGMQGRVGARLALDGRIGLSTDMGGAQTWANDTAMTAMTAAYTYLTGTLGARSGKVALVAGSMGGLNSLVWAAANRSKVACVVLQLPVINVSDIHQNAPGYGAIIDAAWPPSGWSQAVQGPTRNPITLAAAGAFDGLPILMFYGTSDTLCTPTQALIFDSLVSSCTAVPVDGGHDEPTLRLCAAQEDMIRSFVQQHS